MSKELDSGIQIIIYFMCQGFAQFDQQLIYNKTNDFQAATNFWRYIPISVLCSAFSPSISSSSEAIYGHRMNQCRSLSMMDII